MTILDRLLDIGHAARVAETLDELVKLREEADGVLSRTIRQVDANRFDADQTIRRQERHRLREFFSINPRGALSQVVIASLPLFGVQGPSPRV